MKRGEREEEKSEKGKRRHKCKLYEHEIVNYHFRFLSWFSV